ncbi:hypothetical protein GGR58DRAFT_526397 [Xylaria digitata]|nr:hypothetical protein GGR58DRAFT_526397 [Xylaria digitata]
MCEGFTAYIKIVAPRAKLTLYRSGELRQILVDGSARHLAALLTVPVPLQRNQSPPARLQSDCCSARGASRGDKRSDNDEAHTDFPRPQKQIKTQGRDEEEVPDAVLLLSLPLELHRLIFSFVESIYDAIALALEHIDDYYISRWGRWAGLNVVCVGEDVAPNDYPPGLFSADELKDFRQRKTDILYDRNDTDGAVYLNKPFTLNHFTFLSVSTVEGIHISLWLSKCRLTSLLTDYLRRTGFSVSERNYVIRQVEARYETYFPTDQQWILRNLTPKQIVRSEVIALSPDRIHCPNIDAFDFGEVVMSRICWSTSSDVGMTQIPNISRGVWAGHCFDITTLSRHETETHGAEWSDVSDEVQREIAGICEGAYGSNWRDYFAARF